MRNVPKTRDFRELLQRRDQSSPALRSVNMEGITVAKEAMVLLERFESTPSGSSDQEVVTTVSIVKSEK